MTPEAAETLALTCLAYLVNAGDPLDRFLAISGTNGPELRQRAEDPEFLAAIIDFLLSDEALLTVFCDDASIDPRDIQAARRALPGA